MESQLEAQTQTKDRPQLQPQLQSKLKSQLAKNFKLLTSHLFHVRKKIITGSLFLILVVVGMTTALFLIRQNQDIRQQAKIINPYDNLDLSNNGEGIEDKTEAEVKVEEPTQLAPTPEQEEAQDKDSCQTVGGYWAGASCIGYGQENTGKIWCPAETGEGYPYAHWSDKANCGVVVGDQNDSVQNMVTDEDENKETAVDPEADQKCLLYGGNTCLIWDWNNVDDVTPTLLPIPFQGSCSYPLQTFGDRCILRQDQPPMSELAYGHGTFSQSGCGPAVFVGMYCSLSNVNCSEEDVTRLIEEQFPEGFEGGNGYTSYVEVDEALESVGFTVDDYRGSTYNLQHEFEAGNEVFLNGVFVEDGREIVHHSRATGYHIDEFGYMVLELADPNWGPLNCQDVGGGSLSCTNQNGEHIVDVVNDTDRPTSVHVVIPPTQEQATEPNEADDEAT